MIAVVYLPIFCESKEMEMLSFIHSIQVTHGVNERLRIETGTKVKKIINKFCLESTLLSGMIFLKAKYKKPAQIN